MTLDHTNSLQGNIKSVIFYIIGVNHGYQVVGKFPHRTNPSSQLTFHQLSEATNQYQKPFFDWLKVFVLEKNILSIFEEWTLSNDKKSSANLLAEEKNISYSQIDPFPQPVDAQGNVDDELREKIWETKISENFSKTNNNLIIIGDKHFDSFNKKLLEKNYVVETIRKSELEQILIPQIYKDTMRNS